MVEKNSGLAAGFSGVAEGVKGTAKKAVAAVSGQDDLKDEGQAQVEKGSALREAAARDIDADLAGPQTGGAHLDGEGKPTELELRAEMQEEANRARGEAADADVRQHQARAD